MRRFFPYAVFVFFGVRTTSRGPCISWKLKNKVKDLVSKETGTVRKDPGGRVRVCLVYPNTYPLGMGNLGFQFVYHALNEMDGCVAERAFLPDPGDLEEFNRSSTTLFSLESLAGLNEFDIIAFSVSFEEDYFNIPKILRLANIPKLSRERPDVGPLVMAGGVAVSMNPEPIADLIDLFLIGEAEGALGPFVTLYGELKGNGPRYEILKGLDSLESVYVPGFYEYAYEGTKIVKVKAAEGAKQRVRAGKKMDLDKYELPMSFITTPEAGFKETFLAEIERGCGRGCRFCAAGFLYLPPRFRDAEAVKKIVGEGMEATGKVGLVGTAVSEYPDLDNLIDFGIEKGAEAGEKGMLTLSSLRLDCLNGELLEKLNAAGYRTVTLAPEAGSRRMRDVINKDMSDTEILEAVRLVVEAGFTRIKLYFLTGLPGETDEDAGAIVDLAVKIRALMKSGTLKLSVNPFVPKPVTPFQWHPFERVEVLDKRMRIIKEGLKRSAGVSVKAMPSKEAFVQAWISRADRRAGQFIIDAELNGVKGAVKSNKAFMEEAVYRKRAFDEVLAWDLVDHGLKKDYLWSEYERGLEGKLTPPCKVGACFRCGVC